jgi:hypothetical protein
MTTTAPSRAHLTHPRTLRAFRSVKLLIVAYFAVAAIALIATFLMRNDSSEVNANVWGRCVSVVVSSAVLYVFAVLASRGARWAYRRLRIVSIVVPVGIALIIVAPGTYPLWMKIEQGVCGIIVIALAFVINGKHLRSLFSRDSLAPVR